MNTTANDLIVGISKAIDENFSGKYNIYTDEVKQDMKVPCFFIRNIHTDPKKLFDNRYTKKYMFEMSFFPEDKNKDVQNNEVKESIFDTIEYIKIADNMVRIYDYECKETDGVLVITFFIKFTAIRQKVKEDMMEILDTNYTSRRI